MTLVDTPRRWRECRRILALREEEKPGDPHQFKIQEGKQAEKIGATAAVRKFGANMAHDHMMTTASSKKAGMAPPPPPNLRTDPEQMASHFQGKSVAEFDETCSAQQVQSRHDALTLQLGYAMTGDTSAINPAAKGAVAIIRMHLQMAQQLSAM